MYECLLFIKTVAPIIKCFVPLFCVPKPFQDALWFLCLLSDCWLPWVEMNPERLWGSQSRLKIRWRTRLKSPSSIGPASHFKEAVVTSGKEWPRTRSLHEREWRGMSSNLRPAEGRFQVQAGASPSAERGKVLAAFPAGKWHPPFCHVKNPIERNLTNPWGLPRGPERFSLWVQQAWLKKCLSPGNGIYALKQLYTHVKTHVYMFLFHFMKTSSMFSFNRNQQEKLGSNISFNCEIKIQIMDVYTRNHQVWILKK